MGDFLRAQLPQHPEVAPHITLYLFEQWVLRVDVMALKQKVEFQDNMISYMEKMCKKLRLRVNVLTNKANRLSKK